jgi:hypothetical protein
MIISIFLIEMYNCREMITRSMKLEIKVIFYLMLYIFQLYSSVSYFFIFSVKAQAVDHDEDRRNPQYIPKRGTFYEHDDRTAPG